MTGLTADMLVAIEKEAVEFATLAGARISTALGRTLAVRYKPGEEADSLRDPVSEVDHDVEKMLRQRVAETFSGHDVIGEESDARPGRGHDFAWVVDPIDGTTNFVNGFPIFAASIGVLYQGFPVVGAVWCSTSHALRPGVYHARRGGPLGFDSETFTPNLNPAVRRRLVGLGSGLDAPDLPWDARRSGSATVECAFVAAGLLGAARFETPNLWDVAGGIPLIVAAGGSVRIDRGAGWQEFAGFQDQDDADIRAWRGRVALGETGMVQAICARRD
ncbi:MAG: inositol monophosphatase family protein [Rhodobacterales bacterium]